MTLTMTGKGLRQNGDGDPENALRWVVKAHIDDNTCEPCQENNGKLYRNRQAAYRDYPNGRGYTKCVGAEYGNDCRCRVVKRGKGADNVKSDLASLVARAQHLSAKVSARSMHEPWPATAPTLTAAMEPMRAEGTTLYLYDAIGGWDGTKAIDVAQALASMAGPVDLHINSPGGVIFEGAAIYNAIRAYTGGPVTAWIDGYAASAASFVALAASPYDATADTGGVRIADNAVMMIHDGMGIAIGTADDMRDVADLLDMLSDTIAGIYAARAGGTAQDWRDQMREGDTWYNAQQAKDAGLADLVVGQPIPEPMPEPDEPLPAAAFDISLFTIGAPPSGIESDPENSSPPFDLEGLRDAMKGAFA
jgi:ATP-dependent protease ClpP protease subunit